MMLDYPKLQLLPVVELEPHDLGIETFGELHKSGEWPDYWAAKLGELSLRPLCPGSWYVSIDQFASKAQFDLIVRSHFGGEPTLNDLEDLDGMGPLAGGLAFMRGNVLELGPSCCCDVADVGAWRAAIERGEPLYIGHGEYSLETINGLTTITACRQIRVLTSELRDAFPAAEAECESFAKRLEEHLRRREIPRNREIAARLVLGR